jgi:hypothetical protein
VKFKPGERFVVPDTTAELIIVRAPDEPVEIRVRASDSGEGSSLLLGKRYTDEPSGIELLCVKSGRGPLEIDGRAVVIKPAKPLPSSD